VLLLDGRGLFPIDDDPLRAGAGTLSSGQSAGADEQPRHRVDLEKLRIELARANFPQDARTLLQNSFLHPRNFFRSHLSDEAERGR
jgi:hypothetical protein